jgi:hypothetical protein
MFKIKSVFGVALVYFCISYNIGMEGNGQNVKDVSDAYDKVIISLQESTHDLSKRISDEDKKFNGIELLKKESLFGLFGNNWYCRSNVVYYVRDLGYVCSIMSICNDLRRFLVSLEKISIAENTNLYNALYTKNGDLRDTVKSGDNLNKEISNYRDLLSKLKNILKKYKSFLGKNYQSAKIIDHLNILEKHADLVPSNKKKVNMSDTAQVNIIDGKSQSGSDIASILSSVYDVNKEKYNHFYISYNKYQEIYKQLLENLASYSINISSSLMESEYFSGYYLSLDMYEMIHKIVLCENIISTAYYLYSNYEIGKKYVESESGDFSKKKQELRKEFKDILKEFDASVKMFEHFDQEQTKNKTKKK